jgi:hypothetical protein
MRRFAGTLGWALTTLLVSYTLMAAVVGALAAR